MDSNVYDDWLIDVKRKIDSLIKGIWQYSLPPVPELPLETPKYHEQYVELMKRLIRLGQIFPLTLMDISNGRRETKVISITHQNKGKLKGSLKN